MDTRRAAVVLGVLALVVTSGCVSVAPPSSESEPRSHEPDPEAVFEAAFVHSDDLEDVTGEMTVEVTEGNETISETLRVAERPYVDYRDEVLESSNPDRVGEMYVSNATTKWWYYPDLWLAEYVQYDEPFDSDEVRSDRAEQAERQLEMYDLEYQGTEEIAGREAYVLDVEPKAEGVSVLVGDTEYVLAVDTVDTPEDIHVREQTIWIDTEYEYPLKERLVYEGPDGQRNEMVQRYETVSFNEGLDDETFAFEPPEDVAVDELPSEEPAE